MKKISSALIIIIFCLTLSATLFAQNEYPFSVKISGKGSQSIIFIPGFASSGDVWNETRAKFENNFICYTFTMAGFAGAPAKDSISFKYWEDEIAKYIRQNKINKPIFIGHSMGGGLALAIASDYPTLLSKIIVVDALPCLAAMQNPSFKSKDTPDCSGMLNQLTSMSDSNFYKMQQNAMPQLVADTSRLAEIVGWSVKSDRKTFAKMYCDFSNTDLREKIANIQCPSLILLESYFTNFKPAIEAQYKNLKTAQLDYATKGLHFIMYDDKDWYFNELQKFIGQ